MFSDNLNNNLLCWCAISQKDYTDACFAAAVVSLNTGTISKIVVAISHLDKKKYGEIGSRLKITKLPFKVQIIKQDSETAAHL